MPSLTLEPPSISAQVVGVSLSRDTPETPYGMTRLDGQTFVSNDARACATSGVSNNSNHSHSPTPSLISSPPTPAVVPPPPPPCTRARTASVVPPSATKITYPKTPAAVEADAGAAL